MSRDLQARPPDSRHPPVRRSDLSRAARRLDPAYAFAIVVALGGAALAAAIGASGGLSLLGAPPFGYLIFSALAIAGELIVLRLPSRRDDLLLSASSMFAYATAIRYGPGPALVALALAALIRGITDRRAVIKTVFNVAQHGITVAVAGLAYQHLGGHIGAVVAPDLLPALGGAVVYLAADYTLTGTVVALATGARVVSQLVGGLSRWLPVEGVMVAFAPIVPLVAQRSLFMIPLLLTPFAGLLYSGRVAVRAEHDAVHDALTGLPNRVLFRARLEQFLRRTRGTGRRAVVMMLDLDGFKEVNDTLGHSRGDELLQAISQRLRRALREADVVARLGGDEFGVLVSLEAQEDGLPERLAERIHEALRLPFQFDDLWLKTGASIGIACSPEHGSDADLLIQRADIAMYQAKAGSRDHERYDPHRDPNRPDNLRLLQELREGIERDELRLHYQPKIRVADGAVVGVEALARWQHPTRGLLMPVDFIELAERSETVHSLTMTVARQAVRQACAWRARGLSLPISINLSPRILMDVTLASDLAGVLEGADLPPQMLEVEVVETCLISDPERTAEVLERISQAGIRISIDDFGTGYSSLSLLKRLPVDAVKIDRSFVRNLATDADDMAIVEATVTLATRLGLEAIAEGVETPEAWRLLEQYGCHQAQGFHMCRPMPADALTSWLEAGAPLSPAAGAATAAEVSAIRPGGLDQLPGRVEA